MKIQPIQQPTFQMKWESKALPNVTKSKIELANGKKLLIRDGGWYKLQSILATSLLVVQILGGTFPLAVCEKGYNDIVQT